MRSTPPGVSHQEILLSGVVGTAEVVVTSESHLRVARDRLKVARAARHAERTDYLYQGKNPVVVKNEQRNSRIAEERPRTPAGLWPWGTIFIPSSPRRMKVPRQED